MAENPIKKEDIIDAKGILESIATIVDAIKNQLVPAMDLIVKKTTEQKAALEKLNPAQKEDQIIIAEKAQTIQQLDVEQKKNKQTLTEIERLQKQLNNAMSDSAIDSERLKQKINEQRKANKDLVTSENTVAGSLTDLRKKLSELKKAYADADPSDAKSILPGIEKLNKEVVKLEKNMGVHTRGVGNYKGAILDAGKQLIGFAGITALAVTALSKLKEAFTQTERGANFFTKTGEIFKTLLQGIVSGNNIKQIFKDTILTANAADKLNQIRKDDRKDLVEIAKLETDINLLRFKSVDATLSQAEQEKYLTELQAKENELIRYKKADIQEELDNVNDRLKFRKDDIELLTQQSQLEAELTRLEGERSFKIEAKLSAIREKKQIAADKEKEEAEIVAKKVIEAASWASLEKIKIANAESIEIERINNNALIKNDEFYKNQKDQAEKAKEDSIAIEQAKIQAINDISMAALDFASTLIESSKQKELEAAGDNAEKKAKIEKEYAKKEKAIAISQAVISTALAVLNALNTKPYLPLGPIMAVTAGALGAIQIATIAATKFAEGGEVGGKLHSQGGTLIEAEKGEFITKRKSSSKYKGLLKAINDDDPMKIAEELRNKKFHTVWGGVQETLSNVSRQDPYTRLMYEELKNKPFSYQDSDGNTVIVQNNIKRVIKKR